MAAIHGAADRNPSRRHTLECSTPRAATARPAPHSFLPLGEQLHQPSRLHPAQPVRLQLRHHRTKQAQRFLNPSEHTYGGYRAGMTRTGRLIRRPRVGEAAVGGSFLQA